MEKTTFRLKVTGVAFLLASSIAAVVVVAQRPNSSGASTASTSGQEDAKVSHR